MLIPVMFGLLGLLTGGLTLLALRYSLGALYLAGVLFSVGLGLGTWLAQRRKPRQIGTKQIVVSLAVVAISFLPLIWVVLAVFGLVQFLMVFLGAQSSRSDPPIGYWIGLLHAGIFGAGLLWVSLRLLSARAATNLLWYMIGASLIVCGAAIVVDAWWFGDGLSMNRDGRAWAQWATLFLLGNTIMSFLWGVGFQRGLQIAGPDLERPVPRQDAGLNSPTGNLSAVGFFQYPVLDFRYAHHVTEPVIPKGIAPCAMQ
jgi:hypothetical protein